ncbi:DUF5669 family protein [Halomonas sp.]
MSSDGGYLTYLGHESAEHTRALHQILQPART